VNGYALPTIGFPASIGRSVVGWRIVGGTLFCLLGNPVPSLPPISGAIVGIDLTTVSVSHGPIALPPSMVGILHMDVGPSPSAATALYVGDNTGNLVVFDASNLAFLATRSGLGGIYDIAVSPGATELLCLCNHGGCVATPALKRLDIATLSMTTSVPLAGSPVALLTLPSGTLRKAYSFKTWSFNTGCQLSIFGTDPVSSLGTVNLPIPGPIQVIVD
jgi:hypothetical protein